MSGFLKHVGRHLLTYLLVPLALIAFAFSYHRFMVASDYIVEYEGECDPATESCFIGCEDDECTETYPHSWVQKRAADVLAECGPDVTDCEFASLCLEDETRCEIRYCVPEEEECVGPGVYEEEIQLEEIEELGEVGSSTEATAEEGEAEETEEGIGTEI